MLQALHSVLAAVAPHLEGNTKNAVLAKSSFRGEQTVASSVPVAKHGQTWITHTVHAGMCEDTAATATSANIITT
jgi:hypothetical protein